jgi:hypothetical protein
MWSIIDSNEGVELILRSPIKMKIKMKTAMLTKSKKGRCLFNRLRDLSLGIGSVISISQDTIAIRPEHICRSLKICALSDRLPLASDCWILDSRGDQSEQVDKSHPLGEVTNLSQAQLVHQGGGRYFQISELCMLITHYSVKHALRDSDCKLLHLN